MSRVESCGNCRYMLDRGKVQSFVECHRHTPFKATPLTGSAWPLVLASDWCGEHAITQAKDDRRINTPKGTLTTTPGPVEP